MEPNLPTVSPNIETNPSISHEQVTPLATPEVAPIASPEQSRGVETSRGDAASLAMPSVTPVPVQPTPVAIPAPTTTTPVANDNPATAGDEDLIEKEWVTKAKQIIQSTAGDPHEQAKQVSQLMSDYVRKRYGKEIGRVPE